MRAAPLIVAFLGSAGCDVVFGLSGRDAAVIDGPTIDSDPCPNDRDCDLVLDPIDNCVDTPNPDQDDLDDDDTGDRCDPCLVAASPTMDEDGDMAADAADNCPSVVNFDQLDADGDLVGDACDPRPGTADALSCFFAFHDASETTRLWSLVAPWSVQISRLVHFPATMAPFVVAPHPSAMLSLGDAYEVRTIVQFSSAAAGDSVEVGLGVGAFDLATPSVRCVIDGSRGAPTLTLFGANDAVLARQSIAVLVGVFQELSLRFEGRGGTAMFACSVVDGTSPRVAIDGVGDLGAERGVRAISNNAHTVFLSLATYRLGP